MIMARVLPCLLFFPLLFGKGSAVETFSFQAESSPLQPGSTQAVETAPWQRSFCRWIKQQVSVLIVLNSCVPALGDCWPWGFSDTPVNPPRDRRICSWMAPFFSLCEQSGQLLICPDCCHAPQAPALPSPPADHGLQARRSRILEMCVLTLCVQSVCWEVGSGRKCFPWLCFKSKT